VGPEEVEPSQPLRPFGDATFAEIQQAGGRPKPQSKKWVGIVAGAFVVAIFSIFAVNNLMTHRQTKDTTAEVATTPLASTTLSIKKSAGWYRDDPSFYQDFLSQTATLPPSEQQKPETRSLVADALVSNGMILGAEDQIISGIGVASGLVAAYPTSLYGFLGLSSYALWREEIGTLSDLVKRWPTSNLTSTEYRLAKAVVDLRSQNYKAGLESLKTLLTEHPEYYRVQLWSLLGSLDHWRDGEEIFGPGKLQELIKQYERRKGAIRPGGTSPTLYQSLEKKLQKSGLMVAEAPLRKKEERREEKREEPVPKQVETPTPKQAVAATNVPLASPQVVEVKPAPAKKVATEPAPKKTAKVEKQKKSLPKPDPELVALNKQSSKAKQNAMKLFEAGNQKQRENKVDEAVSLYQNALREDPDLAEVYKQLGIIYMNRQEKDRSLRAFKIYLQLRPESEDRQVVQGWISSMQ
jgi:tetratricopeptide (TPR) repeat protein